MSSTASSKRGGTSFGRLSSSIFAAGQLFQAAAGTASSLTGHATRSTASSVPGTISIASMEHILQSALAKLTESLSSRKHRDVKEVASRQLAKLAALLAAREERKPGDAGEPPDAVATAPHSVARSEIQGGIQCNGAGQTETTSVVDEEALRQNAHQQERLLRLKADGRDYFLPFRLACETRSARVVGVALDGIQKLLACGFFSGPENYTLTASGEHCSSSTVSESVQKMSADDFGEVSVYSELLIDEVVRTIVHCAEIADDGVQLHCDDLHGESLVSALRGVFTIFGSSKDPQNQRTAQAALTQIVNTVVRSLERAYPTIIARRDLEEAIARGESGLSPADDQRNVGVDEPQSRDPHAADSKCVKQESELVTRKPTSDVNGTGSCGDRMAALPSINDTKSEQGKENNNTNAGAAEVDSIELKKSAEGKTHNGLQQQFSLVDSRCLKLDALLVFRVLCHMAGDGAQSESHTMSIFSSDQGSIRCKRLALDLLYFMLLEGSTFLQNDSDFIECLRSFLCMSLITNSVSHEPKIFSVSLSLFSVLAMNFKHQLAAEIGVFVDQILLRILESHHSSFEHKYKVLQVLRKLFANPNVALELYFNFDCDVNEKNVFADTVASLSRIAKGGSGKTMSVTVHQQALLRQVALESLATLLEFLFEWAVESLEKVHLHEKTNSVAPTSEDGGCSYDREACKETSADIELNKDVEALQTSIRKETASSFSEEEPDKVQGNVDDGSSSAGLEVPGDTPWHGHQAIPVANHLETDKEGTSETIPRHSRRQHELMNYQRQRKLVFQQGVQKFNKSGPKGLQYLIEHQFIEDNPTAIASFFLNSSGLDKREIGDYLGDAAVYNQKVLGAFAHLMHFEDMEIDIALRKFLTTFRLPGEAQKIDRIMEAFAEKYVKDNRGNFASVDCAFVLAFSLIMLHTDAHSKSIKPENKMTLDVFIKNNRGINNGEDLPPEYLEQLYHRIVSEEWVMEEDAERRLQLGASPEALQLFESLTAALGFSTASANRKKFELFLKESQGIVSKTTELIQRKKQQKARTSLLGRPKSLATDSAEGLEMREQYVTAAPELVYQVPFLFESIHSAVLATLSAMASTNLDSVALVQVMSIFTCSVRLPALFRQVSLVEMFVKALAEACHLTFGTDVSTVLLYRRDLNALQKLFDLALKDGDVFGDGWRLVLECVSQLQYLHWVDARGGGDPARQISMESWSKIPLHGTEVSQHGVTSVAHAPILEGGCSQPQSTDGGHVPISNDKPADMSNGPDPSAVTKKIDLRQASLSVEKKTNALDEKRKDKAITLPGNAAGSVSVKPQTAKKLTDKRATAVSTPLETSNAGTRGHEEEALTIEQLNASLVSQVLDISQVDVIFTQSTTLSYSSVVQFVGCLCEVSKAELRMATPRIFCLQKLVEVADYNMNRIRFVWAKLWALLRDHFIEAGLHTNSSVSLYAVDSLRQLAMKFLAKDELSNYFFLTEFLKPLSIVMKSENSTETTKHFIVEAVKNMIQIRSGNIKSGWKGVFSILAASVALPTGVPQSSGRLSDALERVENAFEVLGYIIRNHLWLAIFENLVDALKTLVAFVTLPVVTISTGSQKKDFQSITFKGVLYLEAIALALAGETSGEAYCNINTNISEEEREFFFQFFLGLRAQGCSATESTFASAYCALLHDWRRLVDGSNSDGRDNQEEIIKQFQAQLSSCWLPILTLLSQLATLSTGNPLASETALKSLFRLLRGFGDLYMSQDMWQMTIRGVLYPLFDDLYLHLHAQDLEQHKTAIPGYTSQAGKKGAQKKANCNVVNDGGRALDWAQQRCHAALTLLVDLTCEKFSCLGQFLSDIVTLIGSCIESQPEHVARLGVEAIQRLIEGLCPDACSSCHWEKIITGLDALFIHTTPQELLRFAPPLSEFERYTCHPPPPPQSPGQRGHRPSALSNQGNVHRVEQSPCETPLSEISTTLPSALSSKGKGTSDGGNEAFGPPLAFHPTEVIRNCVVQLLLIDVVHRVIPALVPRLPLESVWRLLLALRRSFEFARDFNRRVAWRARLKAMGFMKEATRLPGLLKQEQEGLTTLLIIAFRALEQQPENDAGVVGEVAGERIMADVPSWTNAGLSKSWSELESFFTTICTNPGYAYSDGRDITQQYLEKQSSLLQEKHLAYPQTQAEGSQSLLLLIQQEAEREAAGMTPIIQNIMLKGFLTLPEPVFQRVVPDIYRCLLDLTLCDSKPLRTGVREILLRRCAPVSVTCNNDYNVENKST